jgi:galactokinase/mevalonate kinase-like predicted kinase
LIEVGKPWSAAYKIIGNGWGGNVLFICEKSKSSSLVDELINKFYLSSENKVLLSDDLDQYIHIVDKPATGLAVLDP